MLGTIPIVEESTQDLILFMCPLPNVVLYCYLGPFKKK